jgi:hypothetical protein
MKLEWILLCLLLAMCVTVGAALFTPEPRDGQGVPHDQYSDMLQGSPTPPSEWITFLGWTFGVLQIALFVTCMTLGVSRRPFAADATPSAIASRRLLVLLFAAGAAAYVGVWTQIVRTDRAATMSGEVTYLGWFPTATSWMLFGLWLAPLVFVAAYIIGFSRWIMPPESLTRFEALVAERGGQSATASAKPTPPPSVAPPSNDDDASV